MVNTAQREGSAPGLLLYGGALRNIEPFEKSPVSDLKHHPTRKFERLIGINGI